MVSEGKKAPRILRDFSLTALGQYASTGARVLRGLALAALLTPLNLGAVALMNLVVSLSQYSDLGVSVAVMRQIPVSQGGGREEEADGWPWYAIVANLIGGVVIVTGCLVWSLWIGRAADPAVRWAVAAAGVSSLFLGVASATQMVLQAQREFGRAVLVLLSLSVTNLVLSVLGAKLMGVAGVFMGQVAATVLAFVVGLSLHAVRARPAIDWGVMGSLVVLGMPIALMAFMGYGLENIDQLMILGLLSRTELGVYSLVLAAAGALSLLPLSLSNVVGPRLLRAYGESPSTDSIFGYTWRPVRVLASVLPVVIMAAWLVVPTLIVWFLPRYTAAIAPVRVYLVGEYFLGMNLGVSNTLIALKKHPYAVVMMAIAIAANIVLDLVLVGRLGMGLTGVALGSLLTYAIYWFLHAGFVRLQFSVSPLRAVAGNAVVAVPGVALIAYLALVWHFGGLQRLDLGRDALALAAAAAFGSVWWLWGRGHGWGARQGG